VESRVFGTQAKHVEQEKPSLNAAVGFKPAHYEIAAARIEKVGGTQGFGKMLHMDLRYKMWWWDCKKLLLIVVGSCSATPIIAPCPRPKLPLFHDTAITIYGLASPDRSKQEEVTLGDSAERLPAPTGLDGAIANSN
jgi:hypothetical protein